VHHPVSGPVSTVSNKPLIICGRITRRKNIRVTVDTDKVALKISRKNKVNGWFHWDEPVLLPEEVLDIHSRIIPDSMIVRNLPCKSDREAEPDQVDMLVS
jgi:hypothetical protein